MEQNFQMSKTKEYQLTEADRQKIERAFRVMDINKDGRVTAEEAQSGMKVIGFCLKDPAAKNIMKEIEKCGDGTVDYPTYEKLMIPHVRKLFWKEKEEELVRDAFKKFDKNEDGFIVIEEMKKVLCDSTNDNYMSEADVEEFFKQADVNGDGEIDFKEFKKWFSKI